jgi:hypothetical protein
MSHSKKYDYLVAQDDNGWTTEIIRRVTSRTSVVSKSQSGFATEVEAHEWGKKEVNAFLKKLNLGEQEKRRAKKVAEEQKNSTKEKRED